MSCILHFVKYLDLHVLINKENVILKGIVIYILGNVLIAN